MRIPGRNRLMLSIGIVSSVLIVAMAPAKGYGFFWPGWPGEKVPTPTVLPPLGPGPTTNTPPTLIRVPPNNNTPITVPGGPEPEPFEPEAPTVPEPASLLMGLMGLGSIGGVRWWRKRPIAE